MATALAISLSLPAKAAEPTPPQSTAQGWKSPPQTNPAKPSAIPAKDRAKTLGAQYKASKDTALTTSGDGTGFHLLVADEANGYGWKTAATLREDGFDADAWIGNACLTSSGNYAAVAYAPRTFTNRPELMVRGAFTAVVNLDSGKVTKLPITASLAYFSPGCGHGERVVFTQLTHDGDEKQQSRLITVDAKTGKQSKPATFPGQVTSAIPTKSGIVAAHGNKLVRLNGAKETQLLRTRTVPFQLTADADGGVTFIERELDKKASSEPQSWAKYLTPAKTRGGRTAAATVASGKLDEWDLSGTASGRVFITGQAAGKGKLPTHIANPGGLAKGSRMSTLGHAAVSTAWADGKASLIAPKEADATRSARTQLKVLATGKTVTLDAKPAAGGKNSATGIRISPALSSGTTTGSSDSGMSKQTTRVQALSAPPTSPSEGTDERYCAVARNDVKKQAFQPTPRQVEWAVDQAVVGKLDFYRSPNWKNTGMGGYQPQGLFAPLLLAGDPNGKLDTEDGTNDKWHIPAQVLLGITAQESNMWQATRFAVPGVTANSLIGNYYGVQYAASGEQADPWRINWSDADCGYGITQATDGMRLAGKTKEGETALSTLTQEAVALDYTANIAYGAQILSDKWNQTRRAGMKVNDGHPKWIENWFFALWAYNSGFYETADSGGHKGVGWTNNPANPLWKANRTPFLENALGGDDYSHAASPQHWPYEEKVIGWAARPISAMFAPGDFQAGYRPAWWNSNIDRTNAKPPVDLFCNASNDCDPSKISDTDSNDAGMGACTLDAGDKTTNPHWLHCWWDQSATWKNCTTGAQCGNAVHRFNTTYGEQADAASYPPRCSSGLPAGALIVDDLPNGTVPAGSDSRGCGAAKSNGTFTFTYQPWDLVDADTGQTVTTYPGKMDTHQIGAAYGNHFWFTHTRSPESYPPPGDRMKVTGTWKLGQQITDYSGQAKVYAHIPDHGAQTTKAEYRIKHAHGTTVKAVPQDANQSNRWVDLGAYRFNGTLPEVSLDNFNGGNGTKDIAWDAVAFVPGDYDGLNEVRFPEADPYAADVNFETSQVAKDAGSMSGLTASRMRTEPTSEPHCSTGKDKVKLCTEYKAQSNKSNQNHKKTASAQTTQRATVAAASGPVGWCKNVNGAAMYTRTEGCLRGLFVLSATRDGAPIGSATMNIIQEIDLNPKSGEFTTWTEISLVSMTGISSTTLTSFMENCWPTTGCAETVGPWTGSTTWTTGDTHVATRTNTYKWSKIVGGAQILNLDWDTSWSTPQATMPANQTWSHQAFDIRCDNKVGANTGCVFPKFTPTLTMNTRKYPAAAAYYWVLMEKLASHPGSEQYNKPLHRLADDTKAKENRDKMCMLAVAEWNPHPNADGTSCDEYPFAKSRESGGMTLTSGKYCVQMYADKQSDGTWMLELDNNYPYPTWNEVCGRAAVPTKQNTDAGGDLGRFTSEIRILDNDPYYVQTGFEYCDIKSICNIS
ncbi:hypothetical protein [Streptomyces sp. PKU-EA00015]|uniref:golvesin C-terminal-like domain-containing protein n=1 Tax=Streptomyces sp. PKU-EA00015 TaxID=2748326 RepID=UPI0028124995|nr:hypothetical protein [Streptomyces sp. PKU-EA00015]